MKTNQQSRQTKDKDVDRFKAVLLIMHIQSFERLRRTIQISFFQIRQKLNFFAFIQNAVWQKSNTADQP